MISVIDTIPLESHKLGLSKVKNGKQLLNVDCVSTGIFKVVKNSVKVTALQT